MFYHVFDLGLAIVEFVWVLGFGGRLVAIMNSRDYLAGFYVVVGVVKLDFFFTAENGIDLLVRHFARVECRDVVVWVVFHNRTQTTAYLTSLKQDKLTKR